MFELKQLPLKLLKSLSKEERLELLEKHIQVGELEEEYKSKGKDYNEYVYSFRQSVEHIGQHLDMRSFITSDQAIPNLNNLESAINQLRDFRENLRFMLQSYDEKRKEFDEHLNSLYEKYEIKKPEQDSLNIDTGTMAGQTIRAGEIFGHNYYRDTVERPRVARTEDARAPW